MLIIFSFDTENNHQLVLENVNNYNDFQYILHKLLAFTIQYNTVVYTTFYIPGRNEGKGILMNYLEAKIVMLNGSPQIPFKSIAIEAVAMVAVAALLVRFFA